jgi:NAD(P)-dependent dehydrogenase (short-subunit alcohol dehydrogenase family)
MKRALVTGAARGIGKAIATRLGAEGWTVALLDVSQSEAEVAAADIDGAVGLGADIADEASVEAALDAFGGPLDLVVNNAGIVRFGPLLDLAVEDFAVVTRVNLVGTFTVARAAARRMRDANTRGSIVNITSMNGVAPGPNGGAYGATKAGIALLTQQMAIEWGPYGVRVNAIAPGLILAGMSDPIYADPEIREARESKVPLGRLGTSDDIASLVVFLASTESSYITGQNILVDGGVTMSMIANLPRPKSVDKVGMT